VRSELAIIEQERSALREVLRLVAERAAAEADIEQTRASSDASADQNYRKTGQAIAERHESLREAARKEDEQRRRGIIDAGIAGEAEAKGEFARASKKLANEFDQLRSQAKLELQRDQAEASAAFDKREREALSQYAAERKPLDQVAETIATVHARLDALFADYQKFGLHDPPTAPTRSTYQFEDPHGELVDRLAKMETPLLILEGLVIPKSMKGYRFLWIFVFLIPVVAFLAFWVGGDIIGAVGGAAGAIALGFLLRVGMYRLSKNQVSHYFYPLNQAVVDADALAAHARKQTEERLKERRAKSVQMRDDDLQKAKQKNAKIIKAGEEARDDRLRRINDVYAQRMVEIQTKQQVDLRDAIHAGERKAEEVRVWHQSKVRELEEKYREIKERVRARHETAWGEMAAAWREGMIRARASHDQVIEEVDRYTPKWDGPGWNDRVVPSVVPPFLRFGEVRLDLNQMPQGVSADPRLMDGIATSFTFPTLVPFPDRANLLIETPAAGRSAAVAALQATMFRLLTSLPPGHVRFTIIDPIGIGRNFGAFMHLADYDADLVTSQVWTDPRNIEERLADLSVHMEKVTQKYLRNEYATIEEYNRAVGELAEPYRVLVVADFPAQFEERTAQRLASIAAGGLPCGVLTLLAVDTDRPMPPGVSKNDLATSALRLRWDDGRLVWDDPDLSRFPLILDAPPATDVATQAIQRAGAAAKDAKRVMVPFEFISPAEGAWWSRDSRTGIDIPLGKAGAAKRQNITLGHGTSQHVLIAGRTGSGKSTLMHALITNLALNYSPDEVELYLIDFKKGVEFKVYATYELAHASVVAIESEREFGISVLQRLDVELRNRADKFREVGVQDVNGYRNAPGTATLPRILLIVDEFQEFFVEEDRLAQDAALLLDRLVRQGRAFGVHVLLGSQTLGGAYALARSTLGQMAVRIALQCSENDAHLILSEQNSAARLLSRPGEAIYNDANGMIEGNHFFQVVWLSDARREQYLRRLRDKANAQPPVLKRTRIVFEGDAPSVLAESPLLKTRLEAPAWPSSPRSASAWLGDPVAIKEPTAALFRRQAGNHMLIVGQNEEAALGVIAASLFSLAAQYPPATSETVRFGARFAILDGTPEDHPTAEVLKKVASALPHPTVYGGWRDAPRIVAEIAQEVSRRQQPGADDGPEIFLFIHDLPRFRDLRKRDDDFSFSRREEDASPADHIATILREGPGFGVFLTTWCDNVNNLQRVLDHQKIREFELRVLFQMSPNDSSNLLDSPIASKLGPNRAYFSSGEENRLEKFRPYAFPPDEWIAWVREQFAKRG
jgi:energy-coupling factor transporter ATP-binding protein EcfA2